VLASHPAVRAAAVLLRADDPANPRLVAYLVLAEPAARTEASDATIAAELRDYLKQRLPDYMLPAAMVVLAALPTTPNGKLDRRALPAPDHATRDRPYVAPRTPVEQQVAAIWSALLHVPQVGIHDNFFALGGHSLLLTQLVVRIHEVFQVELSLRVLFDAPTIVDMSVAIMAAQIEQEDPDDIARMLQEVRQFSPEDLRTLLAGQSPAEAS
jgi:acyl carrier protein